MLPESATDVVRRLSNHLDGANYRETVVPD